MKIEISRGCVAFYNEINGRDMFEYSEEALKTYLAIICSKINNKQELIDVIVNITERLGEWQGDDKPCDQCGDWVEKYTLEL